MMSDRLANVESNLRGWYDQLAGQEKALRLAEEAERVRLQQRVDETWTKIRKVEGEYARLLSQVVRRQDLPEAEAEVVVAELVEEVELLQSGGQPDNVTALLQEILAERQKPSAPASAKLKVAIPIIPKLVSYELEGDTASIVKQLFPTFVKVYEAIAPEKK